MADNSAAPSTCVNQRVQVRVDEETPLLPGHHSPAEQTTTTLHRSLLSSWAAQTKLWLAGPQPPQIQKITPILPSVQRAPINLLHRLLPKPRQRATLLAIFLVSWLLTFSLPLLLSSRPAHDASGNPAINIACTDTLWRPNNHQGCLQDGFDCAPFLPNQTLLFRCPAHCASASIPRPRYVGGARVESQPLVIGGPEYYRGDSFICGAAVHAGVVADHRGGCGRLERVGRRESFAASFQNGVRSLSFDSYFPLSFSVAKDEDASIPDCGENAGEMIRNMLLLIAPVFTITLALFTTDPAWFFFPAFYGIFAHVALVSEPPPASSYGTATVLPDHISSFAERLLPAGFCAAVVYRYAVKRTLTGLDAQIEKIVLWLGGFWIGALDGYTFSRFNPRRLIAPELGPRLLLALLVFLILTPQVRAFRREGRLIPYLKLYALYGVGMLIVSSVPGLKRHVHHYIYSLMLLSGTSLQTRPSLLFQGILLGLFVNGTARWGFASILELPFASPGAYGSLLPQIAAPTVVTWSGSSVWNITFSWIRPAAEAGLDGISVLVNDVERGRSFFTESGDTIFTWSRLEELGLPEYFRFGYVRDGIALDYTRPGIWVEDGSWKPGG